MKKFSLSIQTILINGSFCKSNFAVVVLAVAGFSLGVAKTFGLWWWWGVGVIHVAVVKVPEFLV